MIDVSTKQLVADDGFPAVIAKGGTLWLVFAKDDRPGWTQVWPTRERKLGADIIVDHAELLALIGQLKAAAVEFHVVRIALDPEFEKSS